MKENVYRKSLKRIEKIENEHGSFENFVITSTNLNDEHRMRMEGVSLSDFQDMEQVYQDLHDLELADLFDENFFVGRFNGKFD
ncbi:MAG: hypothetical protein ACI4R8_00360 [Candidatus Caccovivens sp.]